MTRIASIIAVLIATCGPAADDNARATAVEPRGLQPPPPPRGAPRPIAADEVDISLFYEQLAPMGAWFHVSPYGWVWTPYGVDPEWRPYTLGRWVWTDYGWTWASAEPFGWAVYHYGRWYHDPFHGWVWVPDGIWGPAWVAWRRGDGWIGWAPLPPERGGRFDVRPGRLQCDESAIRKHSWCFVEERHLCDDDVRPHIARSARNVNIVHMTQTVTNYTVVDNRVINQSVTIETIEKRVGRKVPRYRIQDEGRPGPGVRVDVKNAVLALFRPHVGRGPAKRTPDVIFTGRRGHDDKPSAELLRRHQLEMDELARDHAKERAALEDRHKRERARVLKIRITMEELNRRHARERAALEEQLERERKLLKRQHERELKGDWGRTQVEGNRFRFGGGDRR